MPSAVSLRAPGEPREWRGSGVSISLPVPSFGLLRVALRVYVYVRARVDTSTFSPSSSRQQLVTTQHSSRCRVTAARFHSPSISSEWTLCIRLWLVAGCHVAAAGLSEFNAFLENMESAPRPSSPAMWRHSGGGVWGNGHHWQLTPNLNDK